MTDVDPMDNLRAAWNAYYELPLIRLFVTTKFDDNESFVMQIFTGNIQTEYEKDNAAINADDVLKAVRDKAADGADAADAADAAVEAVEAVYNAIKSEVVLTKADFATVKGLLLDADGLINPKNQANPPKATDAAGNQIEATTVMVPAITNKVAGDVETDKAKKNAEAADLAKRETEKAKKDADEKAKKKGMNETIKKKLLSAVRFGSTSDASVAATQQPDADTLYITAENDTYSVSIAKKDDAYIMRLNTANGCWAVEQKKGGAITKTHRSRIAKTRNHKSKNRMTKKHINGKKRGTRVKSMR